MPSLALVAPVAEFDEDPFKVSASQYEVAVAMNCMRILLVWSGLT